MNIGRLIAGALMVAALGCTAVRADTVTIARSGAWEAFGGLTEDDNQTVCGIMNSIDGHYVTIKFYQGDKTFTIQLSSDKWRLKDDEEHAVSLTMDQHATWTSQKAIAMHFSDGSAGLEGEVAARQLDLFVREFRSGNQMRLAFPSVEAGGWTVSLAGSNAVSDALDRCRRAQKASGPSVIGHPLERCMGGEKATPDQMIEACTAVLAAELLTGEQVAIPLAHRASAYETKGDYEHLIADATEAVRLAPRSWNFYASRGRGHFFQADFSAAATDLAKSAEMKDDPYTLIWRFLARRRAGPEGASELAAGAEKLKSKDWPYAVIDFYLERRPVDDLQAAATKPEQKCEAAFYLAEWQLLRANAAEAKPLLQTAADTCPEGFIERSGAQAELKRLGQ